MASSRQMQPPPDFLYGTAWKEDRTAPLVSLALHAGFRAIDTANQRRHYNEVAVGEALSAAYAEGLVTRADLFLQTKYTYQAGQDHRLPYNPSAPFAAQVAESLANSLEHLGTHYVDSLLLHGPASGYGWTEADSEVWTAMCRERDAGRARRLGVSNVSLEHLRQMAAAGHETPFFVQNRCFARLGWDRPVRAWCREQGTIYQGFSLLTANAPVFRHPLPGAIAKANDGTLAQVIFAFALAVGLLPLTGTSDREHMREDLDSRRIQLKPEEIAALEAIAG